MELGKRKRNKEEELFRIKLLNNSQISTPWNNFTQFHISTNFTSRFLPQRQDVIIFVRKQPTWHLEISMKKMLHAPLIILIQLIYKDFTSSAWWCLWRVRFLRKKLLRKVHLAFIDFFTWGWRDKKEKWTADNRNYVPFNYPGAFFLSEMNICTDKDADGSGKGKQGWAVLRKIGNFFN